MASNSQYPRLRDSRAHYPGQNSQNGASKQVVGELTKGKRLQWFSRAGIDRGWNRYARQKYITSDLYFGLNLS